MGDDKTDRPRSVVILCARWRSIQRAAGPVLAVGWPSGIRSGGTAYPYPAGPAGSQETPAGRHCDRAGDPDASHPRPGGTSPCGDGVKPHGDHALPYGCGRAGDQGGGYPHPGGTSPCGDSVRPCGYHAQPPGTIGRSRPGPVGDQPSSRLGAQGTSLRQEQWVSAP